MFKMCKASLLLLAISFLAGGAMTAKADSFTIQGNFGRDDDVRLFAFSLTSFSPNVTLRTTSYAAGGFDPVLSLFNGAGGLLALNDDGPGDGLDSFLSVQLTPGTYLLALTQSDNYPNGVSLSAGFQREGQGNFTGGFIDAFGNQRTGNWSVTFENVASATLVPEPATVLLLGSGLACLAAGVRSKKSRKREG